MVGDKAWNQRVAYILHLVNQESRSSQIQLQNH
jgi:hypothetical protein